MKAFKLLPEHTDAAEKTLSKITKQHLDSKKKKKKSKSKSKKKKKKKSNDDLVYVGIHVRRTDYEHLEKEQGMKRLRPAYYLQAMDMYR